MNRVGACVVAAGVMVVWAGVARADENDPGPRKKIAYVDPNAPIGDTSGDTDATQFPDHPSHGGRSALDVFRIGAFGGVGFPRPLSIEGFAKVENVVGFGVEYSVLPAMSISGVDTTFWALSGDVRVFPFANGFFLGMTGGRQHVGASALATLPAPFPSVPEQITADTWFINPRIGFLSTSSWGLTVGIDAGVQIPLSATFASTIPTNLPVTIPIATDANNTAHYLGKSLIPTVDLLRIGLLL